MAYIEVYFLCFTLSIICVITGRLETYEFMKIYSTTFSWTNLLIASTGYGICKRLDKLINKNRIL